MGWAWGSIATLSFYARLYLFTINYVVHLCCRRIFCRVTVIDSRYATMPVVHV